MMKVTVSNSIKALNARVGKPETSAPNPTYRLPGETLAIDKVEVGTIVDGNVIWYHCSDDGHYYWSGGFIESEFVLDDNALAKYPPDQQPLILLSAMNGLRERLKSSVADYRGLGIGDKNFDPIRGAALTVYVGKKDQKGSVREKIEYCGISIPTDVKEVGDVVRTGVWDAGPPYRMGASIVDSGRSELGTLTIVLEKDGEYYLLSCSHVLLPDVIGVFQRGAGDKKGAILPGESTTNLVTGTIEEGIFNSEFDFAVAQVDKNQITLLKNIVSPSAIQVTDYFDEMDQVKSKGRRVFICGSQTLDNDAPILDPFASRTIGNDSFETSGLIITRRISENGDSGAPVIDVETRKLVGLVIGATLPFVPEEQSETFILPVHSIIKNKHYKIALL